MLHTGVEAFTSLEHEAQRNTSGSTDGAVLFAFHFSLLDLISVVCIYVISVDSGWAFTDHFSFLKIYNDPTPLFVSNMYCKFGFIINAQTRLGLPALCCQLL